MSAGPHVEAVGPDRCAVGQSQQVHADAQAVTLALPAALEDRVDELLVAGNQRVGVGGRVAAHGAGRAHGEPAGLADARDDRVRDAEADVVLLRVARERLQRQHGQRSMRLPAEPALARHNKRPTAGHQRRASARPKNSSPRGARDGAIIALHILQVRCDVAKRLIAPRAIFFEALGDDPLQFGRDVGHHADRLARAVPSGWPRAFPGGCCRQTVGARSPFRRAPRRS